MDAVAPNLVSLAHAHGECEREMKVRQRCFPRWVEEGRVGKMEADDRLSRLEAAVFFLKKLLDEPETPPVS